MPNATPHATFRDPVVNLYVSDVETVAGFYRQHFGFVESFRTPSVGQSIHIELKLGTFTLGLASVDADKAMHGLPLNPGNPRSEVALWTEDVDSVHARLVAQGVKCISEPHTFIGKVRAAWFLDPEGNHVQVVAKAQPATSSGA